jgi:hypothetical protein
MSSLKDVINLQKRQLDRYNELKKDVLKKITNKISHLAKHNELRCIYIVPRYVFGFSTYKVEDITSFLFLHLKKEGFCVVLLSDDKLFISWDIKDITAINDKRKKISYDLSTIKPLINLKTLKN